MPEPKDSKMLVTILGEYRDHPLFRLSFHPSSFVSEEIRRIDLEVDRCMMGSSHNSNQTNAGLPRLTQELNPVSYRLVNSRAIGDIAYHVFHSCGGMFDIRDIKLELVDKALVLSDAFVNNYKNVAWRYKECIENRAELETRQLRLSHQHKAEEKKNLSKEVRRLSCTRCKKTVDVSHVSYDISGLDAVAHALGATGVRTESSLRIGRSEQDSRLYALLIDDMPTDFFFAPSFLDDIYYGAIQERHSLESRLEKLFQNVPPSVMEQLLRETVGNIDATISSLEKEIALDSFGPSFSDAVGRIRLKNIPNNPGYIIKIIKDKATAEKEIAIAKEAGKTLPLALYVPRIFGEHPTSYRGYHLLIMEDLSQYPVPYDSHKQGALRYVGLKKEGLSNRLVHRLYVASLFHTSLTHLVEHPLLLDSGVPQYLHAPLLEERLSSYVGTDIGRTFVPDDYDAVTAFLLDAIDDSGRIVHNDMREPNWVGSRVVDFGNSSRADKGGGIYRDIVRILLAEKDHQISDPQYVQQVVDCYYALRNFEEKGARASKTQEDMQKEYLLTFAQLYTEAPRHMIITCKLFPKEQWQQELDWYQAVTVFAQREFLKRSARPC